MWILKHFFNNYCNTMILACAPPKTSLIPKVNIGSDLDAYVTVCNTVRSNILKNNKQAKVSTGSCVTAILN